MKYTGIIPFCGAASMLYLGFLDDQVQVERRSTRSEPAPGIAAEVTS